jgi:hypothetical protein
LSFIMAASYARVAPSGAAGGSARILAQQLLSRGARCVPLQIPLQLTFRSMAQSDALAAHVRVRAEKLEHLFDRIVSCHVVVELAGHHRHGERYHVSINLGLPGHELLVSHTRPTRTRSRPPMRRPTAHSMKPTASSGTGSGAGAAQRHERAPDGSAR